jgi:hypothetical protein
MPGVGCSLSLESGAVHAAQKTEAWGGAVSQAQVRTARRLRGSGPAALRRALVTARRPACRARRVGIDCSRAPPAASPTGVAPAAGKRGRVAQPRCRPLRLYAERAWRSCLPACTFPRPPNNQAATLRRAAAASCAHPPLRVTAAGAALCPGGLQASTRPPPQAPKDPLPQTRPRTWESPCRASPGWRPSCRPRSCQQTRGRGWRCCSRRRRRGS